MDVSQLSKSVKFSFGIGQMAEGIKNSSFSAFLLFYYNQVLGLSADAAGLAIAISLIFDAITDPMAGTISDRWRSPRGRRHPFMYASALPLAITFYCLFAPPGFVNSDNQSWLFAWMLAFTVLNRGAMTLYHVPHLALGAELSSDYDERTTLVAIRQFLSASGYVLVYGLGFGVFFAPTPEFENGQLNSSAYPPWALLLAVIMFVTIFWSAWGTRSRIPYLPEPKTGGERAALLDILKETVGVFRNRSFAWLISGYIIIIVAFGLTLATQLYMFTFFWELTRFQILTVFVTGPLGSLIGYVVASRLFAWLDKRNAMIAGCCAWMVLQALPVTLYLLDLMPEKGSWVLTISLTVILTLLGASIAQAIVGVNSTIADVADENDLRTGARQEGVLFGAASFAGKCTGALGSLLAGFVLTVIDWPTGESVKTAADLPEQTVLMLGLLAGPGAAFVAVPGVLCLLGYRLDREKTAEIQRRLRERVVSQV